MVAVNYFVSFMVADQDDSQHLSWLHDGTGSYQSAIREKCGNYFKLQLRNEIGMMW